MKYDVKIFKLITGEEVLCKVDASNNAEAMLRITDARTLAYRPDGSAGMMPFIQMAPDRPVQLKSDSVIGTVFPVDPELEKKYLSDTSGIALA